MDERVVELMAIKLAQAEANHAMLQARLESIQRELHELKLKQELPPVTVPTEDVLQGLTRDGDA